jgi:HAD superfamily hydrolase (TIGR01549 family)
MGRSRDSDSRPEAMIVDVDGTLVDSVYHHTIAWHRAFRQFSVDLPVWRIHRRIGMGGDQLVPSLTDDEFEAEHGDDVREAEGERFGELIDEVRALDGAHALLEALKRSGYAVVLASSAKEPELEHYLDLVDARAVADAWTSSADVDSTKPEPDLIEVALERAGTRSAVMIGDSPYDCEAAGRAGIVSVGLLTGGFCAGELRDAGASEVHETLPELGEALAGEAAGRAAPG